MCVHTRSLATRLHVNSWRDVCPRSIKPNCWYEKSQLEHKCSSAWHTTVRAIACIEPNQHCLQHHFTQVPLHIDSGCVVPPHHTTGLKQDFNRAGRLRQPIGTATTLDAVAMGRSNIKLGENGRIRARADFHNALMRSAHIWSCADLSLDFDTRKRMNQRWQKGPRRVKQAKGPRGHKSCRLRPSEKTEKHDRGPCREHVRAFFRGSRKSPKACTYLWPPSSRGANV